MANLTFQHAPNRRTVSVAGADTGWHQLTLPTELNDEISGKVNVTVAIVATGAAGAAGTVWVDFDKAISPTVGFPILSGQTDVFGVNTNIWYKFGTATDTLWFIFAY